MQRRLAKIFTAASLCSLLCVPGGLAAQRLGDFRIIGPGGGGAMFHPTISPLDPQTVLVACDMSASYITHDGGKTWRMFNLRGEVRQFAFDPVDAKVIYAVGIALWRSDDGGDTWQLLEPQAKKVTGLSNSSDEADVSIVTRDTGAVGVVGAEAPGAFAIDPLDNKRLYMTQGRGLWHSSDGGVHWSHDDELRSPVSQMVVVHGAGDHGAPKVVMAGRDGFWLSHGLYPLAFRGPEGHAFRDEEMLDVIDGKVLMLAVRDGTLFRSWMDVAEKNPEVKWRALRLPGEGAKVRSVASGHDGKTIYASFYGMELDGKKWLGIAKSEDLGEHWTLVLKDAGEGAPNFSDNWIAGSLGSTWGDWPHGFDVSTKDHELVYATDQGRTMKSTDGGGHWTSVYSHTAADGGAVSNGLDVETSYGVHFDPFDPKRMFISYTDIDLMRSDDGGESWQSSIAGVPEAWRNTTYWMVFDPAVRGRVWAVMSYNHDLPRPRMWRHRDVGVYVGGVCVSVDGGVHWTKSNEGMPEAAATHIVLDPKSSPAARTLYVATMGHGVFKSTDGGKNWGAKNRGIEQTRPMAWRLTLASDGTLYLVVARLSENGSIGDSRDGALYRSRDGAESWERIALPKGVNGPNGLSVDPSDASRLYLAAWPRDVGKASGEGGGIYTSIDGGANWKLILNYNQHIYDVTLNPENPAELYATGFESSAFHSTDRGEHWQRIAGYNFQAGHRVTPDPRHPGWVYINTFGGGVWYGRVDAKRGVEDIASKEIAP